ncbi:sugar phosphate nucleotidyltransferase [Lewinella cohaerens]|uniref:sugar phosphate nucleotidyltransferase n=1 Tax=Lewinella cohaerens TaxID=70995 RepID=UPI00037A3104|nr:sugar phosphate nucleotidyltransferase [Lewinella cohaerens]
MKAVIPVAGAGKRLRPLTYTQPKPLIPVAGKPIISFIVDQLLGAGVEEFIFIVGYLGEKIESYIQDKYPDLKATFVTQTDRLGSGHALWIAREHFADAEEIIIFFGDVIIDAKIEEIVHNQHSCLAVKKVADPRQFGVVELRGSQKVHRLVEKPRIPRSDLAMVGIYKIKEVPLLIDALSFNISREIKTNEQFPLTDALMRMLEKDVHFDIYPVDNWFDCGQREVLLETNAIFLDREGFASEDIPNLENSIIIHPVSIGKDCRISNSIIGPHVTVGSNVMINNAILKESIIGNYTSIKEVILQRSVVGNDTSITGLRQSLNIGDNTEIDFSNG